MGRRKISKNEEKVTCDRCRKCVYHLFCDDTIVLCGYMYYTNKRRPCEPDTKCTVFMPLEGNEKYRKELRANVKEKY